VEKKTFSIKQRLVNMIIKLNTKFEK